MALVIFYEKPGCGGNARQKKTLSDSGHQLEVRDLLSHPWSGAQLLAFLGRLPVAEWFNRAAPLVKSGEIVPEKLGPTKALELLLENHLLIRRPLMQVGEDRMVGWDEAKVAAWIGLQASGVGEGCPKHESAPSCPPPTA